MNTIDLSQISTEELEKILLKKQEEQKRKQQKAKEEYEFERDIIVNDLVEAAKLLQQHMITVKQAMMEKILYLKSKAEAYGGINKKSKGGFSVRNADNSMKVVYERNVKNEYDERAQVAEDLIKEFLSDTVKKRDKTSYELITGLLEENKKGDYSPALISKLLKFETTYDDERWKKACKLFKEAYNEVGVSYSVSLYEKNEFDKDELISLTFASLPVTINTKQNDN